MTKCRPLRHGPATRYGISDPRPNRATETKEGYAVSGNLYRTGRHLPGCFDDESIIVIPELTAADVPEWDSFNHINLIVAIEQRFKIKFHTAELEQLHTAGHLANLIRSKLTDTHR